MTWIQAIFDFLRQFWPFEIVYSYEQGVRFWLGNDTKELNPGLYMFVPFFGSIEKMHVRPDVLYLTNQELTTLDGVGITTSVTMLYEIHDARAAYVNVQSVEDNIMDACRAAISQEVRRRPYVALLVGQEAAENAIADRVAAVTADWGVQIHRINFASFIKTKNISLVNRH